LRAQLTCFYKVFALKINPAPELKTLMFLMSLLVFSGSKLDATTEQIWMQINMLIIVTYVPIISLLLPGLM
jgi:hypothetical protein